jgi:PKD repeat protein
LALLLIVGTVSADTLVVYADTADDGSVRRTADVSTWTSLVWGVGTSNLTAETAVMTMGGGGTSTTLNRFLVLVSFVWSANTSAIPDDATIDSAKMSYYAGTDGSATWMADPSILLFSYTPGTPAQTSDYQRERLGIVTGSSKAADSKAYLTWNAGGRMNFTIYDSNLTYINKTGYTGYKLSMLSDASNTTPYWASGVYSTFRGYDTSYTGATRDPFLEITYTPSVPAPVASFTPNATVTSYPDYRIAFTDTSTNTPTSWNWTATNVTGNNTPVSFSTSQSPVQTFYEGNWSIQLNATNAGGSNLSSVMWINLSECNGGIYCTRRIYSSNTGYMENTEVAVYPTKRNGVGYIAYSNNHVYGATRTSAAADIFFYLRRGGVTIPTSSLPDSITISNSTLSLYGYGKYWELVPSSAELIDFTPLNATTYVAADYNRTTFTPLAANISNATFVIGAYNTFTLNTAGVSGINTTGDTAYMLTESNDVYNYNLSLVWASGVPGTGFEYYSQAYGSGVAAPYLIVNYTVSGGATTPVASFTCTKNLVRIPNSITCTDSSTNTPTSWSWNMGDGSAAVTTQNVTYKYTKRGMWGITLNATNAGGSNTTPAATNVRVVGYENYW